MGLNLDLAKLKAAQKMEEIRISSETQEWNGFTRTIRHSHEVIDDGINPPSRGARLKSEIITSDLKGDYSRTEFTDWVTGERRVTYEKPNMEMTLEGKVHGVLDCTNYFSEHDDIIFTKEDGLRRVSNNFEKISPRARKDFFKYFEEFCSKVAKLRKMV